MTMDLTEFDNRLRDAFYGEGGGELHPVRFCWHIVFCACSLDI